MREGYGGGVPLYSNRHYSFRNWHEYSGGKLTDWGAHHVDIACWALGATDTGPSLVTPVEYTLPVPYRDGHPTIFDQYNAATEFTIRVAMPDAVEMIHVKHSSAGTSICQINSYDQGREAFQGTERDVIWLDEECPDSVYTEALMRTMTTDGIVILTFTPLLGLTPLVLSFLPDWVPSE
jgi:phage terminase large subunit-like protein